MFVNQKAQEISYALVRVAPYIRRVELRHRLERLGLQLLEEVGLQNFEVAIRTASVLEGLINIGKSVYEIEPVNASVIIGELRSLSETMAQLAGIDLDSGNSADVAAIFSKVPAVVPQQEQQEEEKEFKANQQTAIASSDEPGSSNGNGLASTIRQSAILEKIRQSPNRQSPLKELIAAFPEVSERTMRYDLQKLCNQGLIERVGNGGPGSYYTIRP